MSLNPPVVLTAIRTSCVSVPESPVFRASLTGCYFQWDINGIVMGISYGI